MALRLLENEQVVCTLRKTPLIWVKPVALGFLTLFLLNIVTSSPDAKQFFTSLGIISLIFVIVEILRRYRYAGYVTTKRIILHYGLFLHEREIRFEQLEGVNVERYKSIFWHQIHVNGTGGTSTMFDYAGNYNDFKNTIYEAKEQTTKTSSITQ